MSQESGLRNPTATVRYPPLEGEGDRSQMEIVLDRISDGFFTLDSEWRFTYVNSRGKAILGRDDLVGNRVWDLYSEADAWEFKLHYERAFAEQRSEHFRAYYAPHDRWYEVHAYPSPDGLTVYFRDVTEQQRTEREIQVSNERFRLVARATRDLIYDLDLLTGAAWRSDAIQASYGYSLTEISPRMEWWISLIHPEEREAVRTIFLEFLESDAELCTCEYRLQRRDGSYARVMDRICAVRDENGKAIRVVGVATDLTEHRRAEELIRDSQHKLRALSRRLISIQEEERKRISRDIHDLLGHWLTAIKFRLHQAHEADSLPSSVLQEIQELVDHAVGQVRDIARSLRPPMLEDVGLQSAIEREVVGFEERTGITCETDLDPRVAVEDERSITAYRILQESLTNVARHSRATRARVTLQRRGGRVHLRISDNGRGITKAEISGEESLGLVGMRERALLLGGTLQISRARTGGTVVALSFPESALAETR